MTEAKPEDEPRKADEWLTAPERGIMLGIRALYWLATAFGRWPARTVVKFVAFWYRVFDRRAAAASRDYLTRVNGKPPGWWDVYRHILRFAHVSLDRMRAPRDGQLVAWVTTAEIDHIERMGALDEHLQTTGRVDWNKYIVVITLEPGDDPSQEMWTGPIVMRGMSRSGMMHTMVGHGALQQENCAAYGYGN